MCRTKSSQGGCGDSQTHNTQLPHQPPTTTKFKTQSLIGVPDGVHREGTGGGAAKKPSSEESDESLDSDHSFTTEPGDEYQMKLRLNQNEGESGWDRPTSCRGQLVFILRTGAAKDPVAANAVSPNP